MKSEDEATLAHSVKMMNKVECFQMEGLALLGNWDNWWKCRDQSQDLDRNNADTIDHKLHQETVDWRLEGICADEHAAQLRACIITGRARMP